MLKPYWLSGMLAAISCVLFIVAINQRGHSAAFAMLAALAAIMVVVGKNRTRYSAIVATLAAIAGSLSVYAGSLVFRSTLTELIHFSVALSFRWIYVPLRFSTPGFCFFMGLVILCEPVTFCGTAMWNHRTRNRAANVDSDNSGDRKT